MCQQAADSNRSVSNRFASLTPMLNPATVAIIGASADPARIGGRPIAYMLRQGFAGTLLPVNPNRSEIQGLRAYPSVADLPLTPDVAVIAVAAAGAAGEIEACVARGVKSAIVLSAGFAETGEAGAAEQVRMIAAARSGGMRLIGPNCLGLFNARINFYPIFSASFENGWPIAGRIGIASQSGAYGTHLFAAARDRRIGAPICVTTGNEGDVTIGDVIGWLVEDPETDVIVAYAEGIREADSFLAALAAARAARKPVVMMKVGRSALGTAAAVSHTASIAGDDAVTDAVLAEFGVHRARGTEDLLDVAYAATKRIYPARNTLGVITVSGGAGVLISDAADELGLSMPPMPEAAQARLKALLPFSATRNPVDCTAQAINDSSLIGAFGEAVVGDGGYSSILAFFTHAGGAPSIAPRLREQLGAIKARHPERLYCLSVIAPPPVVKNFEDDGFLVFEDPTRATVALDAMGRFGAAFAASSGLPPPVVPHVEMPGATPTEAEAKRTLAEAAIATVFERACADAASAVAAAEAIGYPVVLKILSQDIVHKSEIGGVILGVADADAVRAGFATLLSRASAAAPDARIEGVLVARQITGGVECILGIHRDPVFGPMAMFGLGGIFVEVLKDVVLHRCPFGVDVAERMIRSIKGAPLLLGARGRAPVDIPALSTMLARLSVFAVQAGPTLRSIDLNPVIALPTGEGAFAADAVLDVTNAC